MKKLLIIISGLMLTCTGTAQVNATTAYIIFIASQEDKTNPDFFYSISEHPIYIYKLPQDTLVLTLTSDRYDLFSRHLSKLTPSGYKVVYENRFRQTVTKTMVIEEGKANNFIFCTDSLLSYPQNTIAKLKKNDSIVVSYASFGCFHNFGKYLVIKNSGGALTAQLYKAPLFVKKTKGKPQNLYKLIREGTMTESGKMAYVRFENEIQHAVQGQSTTSDSYQVKSKLYNFKLNNFQGKWDGFNHLVNAIFGPEQNSQ